MNSSDLLIRVRDYNEIHDNKPLLKTLRKLTLHKWSGMNHELNKFEDLIEEREVKAKIITVAYERNLVAWAILSKEDSDFGFSPSSEGYRSTDGLLFEIFVDYKYRKMGIATEVLKIAKRKANVSRLCVCPHDKASNAFYDKFNNFPMKRL